MIFDIEHICAASLRCESRGAFSEFQLDWKTVCIEHIFVNSLQCESRCGSSDVELHWKTLPFLSREVKLPPPTLNNHCSKANRIDTHIFYQLSLFIGTKFWHFFPKNSQSCKISIFYTYQIFQPPNFIASALSYLWPTLSLQSGLFMYLSPYL